MIIKQSNEGYMTKLLLKFPLIFRPTVSQTLQIAKQHIEQNNYTKLLKSLANYEDATINSIQNPYTKKTTLLIKKIYRDEFTYLMFKIKEFSIPTKFIAFSKELFSHHQQ